MCSNDGFSARIAFFRWPMVALCLILTGNTRSSSSPWTQHHRFTSSDISPCCGELKTSMSTKKRRGGVCRPTMTSFPKYSNADKGCRCVTKHPSPIHLETITLDGQIYDAKVVGDIATTQLVFQRISISRLQVHCAPRHSACPSTQTCLSGAFGCHTGGY